MNCWEFKKCPEDRKKQCPAFPGRGLDCWKVTGTMCMGIEQGTTALKIAFCRSCNFYNKYANKF